MSSWETAALRLQSNVTADSTPNPSHKSLPPLPRQKTKSRTVTGVKEVSGEEEYARTKGWKPLSLSIPILSAVIALTLLLAVAIETLAQRSASQGGLALSPTLEEIPYYAKFCYLYVPTIIAVFYSMIWSWIDLDVKRMQPWFEMSKKDGTTAENSLFLDYQYEFVGLVPFKAAKHKYDYLVYALSYTDHVLPGIGQHSLVELPWLSSSGFLHLYRVHFLEPKPSCRLSR